MSNVYYAISTEPAILNLQHSLRKIIGIVADMIDYHDILDNELVNHLKLSEQHSIHYQFTLNVLEEMYVPNEIAFEIANGFSRDIRALLDMGMGGIIDSHCYDYKIFSTSDIIVIDRGDIRILEYEKLRRKAVDKMIAEKGENSNAIEYYNNRLII